MLKQKAKTAVLWSGADILLRQGLQFGVSIALARMLSPDEFGTIALLYLFTGIASAFVDSGFSAALVQRQNVTHTDESTVFWFNLVMALMVALALAASAPFIAAFFDRKILIPLTWLLSLNIIISALGSVHGTLLNKRLDFKTQMKIGAITTILSGSVAMVMAWQGYGVWALAVQTLAATLVTTALLWFFSTWRPKWVFSFDSARRLFGFGGYLLAAGMLDIIYNRIYSILIGKFYGVRELGFYNRADSTKQLPVGVLTGVLGRVAFPIFSAAAHDVVQLRRGVRLALRGMMLVNAPMMLGLAAVAEPLIHVLFGAKWLPAVPIMQVLCIGGVFWPLHVINLNVLMAQGYSHLFFKLEVAKKIVGSLFLIVGAFYGVLGIAWSQVIFGAVAFLINAYYSKRFLDYGIISQIQDFAPVLLISTVMASAVYLIDINLYLIPILQLLTLVISGTVIFLVLGHIVGLSAMRDVINLFRKDFLLDKKA
ncbi:lipopolysaccharide biosynthesis protein [Glaciimonas sp. PCH181]|uniref:lipopolysaccharide biosynthesis protein n=1 Tax=Glaciimonas sp. PCH181 TaxID=2133943 RepID=UPI000D361DCE|nr:lipopolysaccharide biosynthesis protein [Glaciimonas sp. PCH181]PUA16916.1 flippase [Glaciimonas sp. PCH181]